MSNDLNYIIRPYDISDKALIHSSWKNSLKVSATYDWMPSSVFYNHFNKSVMDILAHKHTTVLVACDDAEQDLVLGWICAGDDELHYVYVKEIYRKMGVARKLMWKAKTALATTRALACTHWTDIWEVISWRYPLRYAPSRLYQLRRK